MGLETIGIRGVPRSYVMSAENVALPTCTHLFNGPHSFVLYIVVPSSL